MPTQFDTCPKCIGSGFVLENEKQLKCPKCEGTGKIRKPQICRKCNGEGIIRWKGKHKATCDHCGGSGVL